MFAVSGTQPVLVPWFKRVIPDAQCKLIPKVQVEEKGKLRKQCSQRINKDI